MKATPKKCKGCYFADSDAATNRTLIITDTRSNSDDVALNTHFEKSGINFIKSKSNVSKRVENNNNKTEKTVPLRQRTLPASFWQEPDDRSYRNMTLYASALNQPQMIMNDPLTQQYISQYYGIHWPPGPQASGELLKLLINRQQYQQSQLPRFGVVKPAGSDIGGVFSHRLVNLQNDGRLHRINTSNVSQSLRQQQCYNDSNYPLISAMHMRKASRYTTENILCNNTITSSPAASNHRNSFLSDPRTFYHSKEPDFRFSPCNIRNALDWRNFRPQNFPVDFPMDKYIPGNVTGAETLYHQPITCTNTRIPMLLKPIATKSGLNGNRYHPYNIM